MLLPAKAEVARHLEQYRTWERLLLVAPADHAVRGNFENTGYTLCVLMGKRCAREAVDAAEHYLRGGSTGSAASCAGSVGSRAGGGASHAAGSPVAMAQGPQGSAGRTASRTAGRYP
jgi:hypothetical protein